MSLNNLTVGINQANSTHDISSVVERIPKKTNRFFVLPEQQAWRTVRRHDTRIIWRHDGMHERCVTFSFRVNKMNCYESCICVGNLQKLLTKGTNNFTGGFLTWQYPEATRICHITENQGTASVLKLLDVTLTTEEEWVSALLFLCAQNRVESE